MPTTVNRAATIAKIQQKVVERSKLKYQRANNNNRPYNVPKGDTKPVPAAGTLWRDRQLRGYRKANGLCYNCGEKFEPGQNEVCSKRAKPAHNNAIVLNELDRELSDDVLNQLTIEDELPEQFGQLSLNAISSADHSNCIRLKTKVKDKVMLILVDSESSHSFVSSTFVQLAGLTTTAMKPKRIKLANGECLTTDKQVPHLQWYCQGHTLSSNMIVLRVHI
jgi:hypothetical protein